MDDNVEIITAREGRKPNEAPLVSVVIIDNGGWWALRRSVESIVGQSFQDFELIVVDNGQAESEAQDLIKTWPRATVLKSHVNMGFCRAANKASAIARGRYLFFLESRTLLNEKSLGKLVETIETEPDAGIVGPLMLNKDRSLHSVGMRIDALGQPCPNRELFGADTELVENVFYVPGSAMIVNKQLFAALEGFDEGYFSGLEDADICWRTRLLGRKIVINPWAIAIHGDRGDQAFSYLEYRNSLRMIIKNYGGLRAAAGSTKFVSTTIVESFRSLIKLKPGLAWHYWKALSWNLVMLPSSIRERRHVQSRRLETDELILRDIVLEEERLTMISSDRAA